MMNHMKRVVCYISVLLLIVSLTACKNQQNESVADVQVEFGFEVHDGDSEENAEILKSLDEIRKTIQSNPGFGMAQYEAAELVVIMKPRRIYLADKDGTLTGQVATSSNYVIVGDGEYLCSVAGRLLDGKFDGVAISATINESRSEALNNCCKDNKNRKVGIYYPPDGIQPVEFVDENAADSNENKVFCVLKDTRSEKDNVK